MDTNQVSSSDIQKNQNDDVLWKMAKKRASFKWSFFSYIIVNTFLVGVWYFSYGRDSYFWPIWPMLGWGLGIAMHYFEAYHGSNVFSVQKEYDKLKNKKQTINDKQ